MQPARREADASVDSSPMKVLGIESSCDETGVALVDAGTAGVPRLLAEALHTQAAMHADYGGVVPELASRDHIRRVLPLMRQVMSSRSEEHTSELQSH